MKKPFLYIHIPKTAGMSIEKSGLVDENDWADHSVAKYIENINNFFSFAFIRNPYKKVLSSYYFLIELENKENRIHNISKYNNFENAIKNYDKLSKWDALYPHFEVTSYEYIVDSNGNELVDYWGWFDNLHEEFIKVQKMNDVLNPVKLDIYINKTDYNYWKTYYNEEIADIVYNKWKDDFDYFGFDKDSWK